MTMTYNELGSKETGVDQAHTTYRFWLMLEERRTRYLGFSLQEKDATNTLANLRRIHGVDKVKMSTTDNRVTTCTSDNKRETGWNHSTMTGDGKVILQVYRVKDGVWTYHPVHGTTWKWKNGYELEKIKDLTDKIGHRVGSLKYYERRK